MAAGSDAGFVAFYGLRSNDMTDWRIRLKAWVPPIALNAVQRLRGGRNRFDGDYATWDAARAQCSGYDDELIVAKVVNATLKVNSGAAAFERDTVVFEVSEYVWPLLAGLLWAAARNGGKLNVLDFGGSLGSTFFQHLKFLDALPELRWNIVEQAHFVKAGRELLDDSRLHFYSSIGESCAITAPNVILLSSVLQYLPRPYDILDELSGLGAAYLIIDRTPFATSERDHIVIQTVPKEIYPARYPMWVFSLPKFRTFIDRHWELVASNTSPEGTVATGDAARFAFQGMLLERRRC